MRAEPCATAVGLVLIAIEQTVSVLSRMNRVAALNASDCTDEALIASGVCYRMPGAWAIGTPPPAT